MQKRAIIVHGWDGYPSEGWFPWLKEKLEHEKFQVIVPQMPNPAKPIIEDWVSHLADIGGIPDEKTVFIGHSIGCQTILRYLETLPDKIHIAGAVFVAGWFVLGDSETAEEKSIAEPWVQKHIDFEKIKLHTKNFVAIFSDDDNVVPSSNQKMFHDSLDATTIIEHERGHFSGSDGVAEIQSVFEVILELVK